MTVPYYLEIERADVGQRSHASAMRDALRAVAIRHLRHVIPLHFQKNSKTAPGGVYGYAPRHEKYLERKRRKKGTDDPLVYSDELEKEQRRTAYNSAISATQHGSTLRLKSPHVLKKQQWKELTAVAPDELKDHAVFAAKAYTDFLKQRGARRSRKTLR